MTEDSAHDGDDVHPDDRDGGVNRQLVLGGVVVALTLAIAAWLAYGVVQRSTTNPRAAGLVPDGANSATHNTTTSKGARHGTTTTLKGGATTTTRKKKGGQSSQSSTPGTGAQPPSAAAVGFAARWHAYSTAWIGECQSIWHNSTNGKLYDPDDIGSVYTVGDCTGMLDQLFMTANVTSVPIATREGHNDAASFTAQLTLSGRLCWIDPATDQIRGCWMGA